MILHLVYMAFSSSILSNNFFKMFQYHLGYIKTIPEYAHPVIRCFAYTICQGHMEDQGHLEVKVTC